MRTLGDLLLVLVKDLRLELRSLDGLASMIFLAGVVTLILALALSPEGESAQAVGAGVLWVSLLLAATIGLGRMLSRERRLDGFRGMLLAPISRSALFLGKSAALSVLLLTTEAVMVPLCALLFGLDLWSGLTRLVLLLALVSVGYAMVGTLLGAIAMRTRTGDLLLGAIIYPLVVPLLVGGVKGTMVVLSGGEWADLQPWVGLLFLTDAVFLVAGLWLFESLTTE